MEKEKRRKKLDEGRIDAEKVINELMEGVDLKQGVQEEAESKLHIFFREMTEQLKAENGG